MLQWRLAAAYDDDDDDDDDDNDNNYYYYKFKRGIYSFPMVIDSFQG